MFSQRLPVTLGRGQFNKILSFFQNFRNFEFLLSAWLLLFGRFQKMFVKEKDEIFGLKVVLLTCFAGQNNVENCYSVFRSSFLFESIKTPSKANPTILTWRRVGQSFFVCVFRQFSPTSFTNYGLRPNHFISNQLIFT